MEPGVFSQRLLRSSSHSIVTMCSAPCPRQISDRLLGPRGCSWDGDATVYIADKAAGLFKRKEGEPNGEERDGGKEGDEKEGTDGPSSPAPA